MKQNFRKLFIDGALALLLGMTMMGCKKDDNNGPVVSNGRATIIGYLKAQLNTNTADYEPAANVKVQAIINSGDLLANPDPNKNYPNIVYNTITDVNGKYTFNVDANGRPVKVTIYPQDFEAKQNYNGDERAMIYKYPGSFVVSKLVYAGSIVYQDSEFYDSYVKADF
ncbi:hypothetical protein MYP_73 [Sporocytophaga myxococcoides]|uniref:Lipoprotein n=1 Tax=Sporocytophaga myxococcoides TaxID=153721 RepID=A0A098L8Q5_9BACT|nr:hypothetical protein [Sporocytophaga myxococcoides]GAL82847.1 hypothetical protein MYP_73 [Sporocytophaga myxococcoides]